MKSTLKRIAALVLSIMCIALVGCGGSASTPESCKDWTEGVMSINGGMITVGKTTIEEFMNATGFDEVVKTVDGDTITYYNLTDGYSVLEVWENEAGAIVTIMGGTNEECYIDAENTTVIGPGGITVGVSKVEDLAAYDENTEGRYNSSVSDKAEYCEYIAGLAEGTYDLQKGYLYSVTGDLETRIIETMLIQIGYEE